MIASFVSKVKQILRSNADQIVYDLLRKLQTKAYFLCKNFRACNLGSLKRGADSS